MIAELIFCVVSGSFFIAAYYIAEDFNVVGRMAAIVGLIAVLLHFLWTFFFK